MIEDVTKVCRGSSHNKNTHQITCLETPDADGGSSGQDKWLKQGS